MESEQISTPKFRYWAGKPYNLIYREPPKSAVGVVPTHIYASAEELQDLQFRRKHNVMLATGVKDIFDKEIYEGDIVEVDGMHGYIEHLPRLGFTIRKVAEESLVPGVRCSVVANFFENPEWVESFGNLNNVYERWSS